MTSHKPGDIYFGEYVRFSTSDKKGGAALAGPDNAVGDIGTIEFVLDDSKRQVAWLKNPYGQLVGFLNNHDSYKAGSCITCSASPPTAKSLNRASIGARLPLSPSPLVTPRNSMFS